MCIMCGTCAICQHICIQHAYTISRSGSLGNLSNIAYIYLSLQTTHSKCTLGLIMSILRGGQWPSHEQAYILIHCVCIGLIRFVILVFSLYSTSPLLTSLVLSSLSDFLSPPRLRPDSQYKISLYLFLKTHNYVCI